MSSRAITGVAAIVVALAGCGSARRQEHPSGTLYLAGAHPGELTIVDVGLARVTTHRVRELAPGDPPQLIATAGGRLVVYGHDHTFAFGRSLREPGRDLGSSWFFVPSAEPGRVWLMLLDRRSPPTVRALRAVREVTVRGAVTARPTRRPPRWPLLALRSGLVLAGSRLDLWNPETGRITRLPGAFPIAAYVWRLVSYDAPLRGLYVTDTRTGARTVIRHGRGFRFLESYDGAFSPDGRLVAVPAADRHGTTRVAVVDIARHSASLVAGPRLAADYQLMAWSRTGWLFYNVGHGRIAAYHPVAGRAKLLPLRVPPPIDIAAL